jgi:ABC-type transport system involved in Fe-S cluster assembly fused permease/ATPase subunit
MSDEVDPGQVISVSDSERPPAVPQLYLGEYLLVILKALLASGLTLIAEILLMLVIPWWLILREIQRFYSVLVLSLLIFPLIVFVLTTSWCVSSVRSEKAAGPSGQGK